VQKLITELPGKDWTVSCAN